MTAALHIPATSLPRLMQCGYSRQMPTFRTESELSDDAQAGIAAHWLVSESLHGRISDLDEWIDRKSPNGVYITDEMVDHVRWFVEGVTKDRSTHRRFVETDMTAWNSDRSITIGCRPDFLTDDQAEYNRRIRIDDYKYGWSIVEVDCNWQLLAYACAYIADKVVDPDTVFELRIWQPRPHHRHGPCRLWIIDAATLTALRSEMFNTLAAQSDQLRTGPYCKRCPAVTNCPAAVKGGYQMLEVIEHGIPDELTLEQMSMLMDQFSAGDYMLTALKEALGERIAHAIQSGQSVRNYRIEPTTGSLAWNDGVTADWLQLLTTETVAKPAPLKTPTQLSRYIPEAVMKTISYRKPGGHKLVRRDAQQLAQEMFGSVPLTGDHT